MFKIFISFVLFAFVLLHPITTFASHTSDPTVSLLQSRISNNFEKEDLANQISIKVINQCGWSFGLIGKEGIDYFKSYFLEIYKKTTPEKKLSS